VFPNLGFDCPQRQESAQYRRCNAQKSHERDLLL